MTNAINRNRRIDNNEAIIIREYGADYNIRTESVLLVDAINSIDRQLKPWRETTPDEIREESFDMGSIISHLNQIDRHLKKGMSWAEYKASD